MQKKNKQGGIALVFVFLIAIALIIAGVFYFKSIRKKSENKTAETENEESAKKTEPSSSSEIPLSQNVFSGNQEEYQKIIGEWDTGCLIANPGISSPERHEFSLKENGVAQHWRSVGESCNSLKRESITNNYKIGIPEAGKINFIALDKDSDNVYDIYKISGGILYFGHGPRDFYPLSLRNYGGSPETRFDALNDFLKYKKK